MRTSLEQFYDEELDEQKQEIIRLSKALNSIEEDLRNITTTFSYYKNRAISKEDRDYISESLERALEQMDKIRSVK